MSNVIRVVAGNLRRLRAERGVSASELARRSGLGRSTLSELEAGRGNPTVGTLWSLADALGVPFGELVWEPERRSVEVLRAGEGTRAGGEGEEVRLLGALSDGGRFELYEMRLRPGARREAAAHPEGVAEYVLVTEGTLLAGPADGPAELGAGDLLRFPGDRPHLYAAPSGGGEARAVVVVGYPARRRDREPATAGDGRARLLGEEDLALIRAAVERSLREVLDGRGGG
jgi:transcriptional regulator with XRE-family HTH domain